MFLEERQESIMNMLTRDGKVRVKELSEKFKVTEDCIRKDLGALEKQGRLKRTYGGAVVLRENIHAGLMDFTAPILLNGKQIGSILGGQVLTEPLDENKFRRIAGEIGVDPEKYVEAVRKIKYIPRQNLESAAQVLYLMPALPR